MGLFKTVSAQEAEEIRKKRRFYFSITLSNKEGEDRCCFFGVAEFALLLSLFTVYAYARHYWG